MAETAIEWADAVWNPLAGCTEISPGCAKCYAAVMAKRLEAMGQQKYAGLTRTLDNGKVVWTGKIMLDEVALAIPLKRAKPTMYFVNSMSDLFHEDVPDKFIRRVLGVMSLCGQHTFQVLTKRAERMAAFFADDSNCLSACQAEEVAARDDDYTRTATGRNRVRDTSVINGTHGRKVGDGNYWPLGNVWLGVSVEDQARADERIPLLLKTPAAVRFLSCEPLLSRVILHKYFAQCQCGSGHGFTACPNTGGVAPTCSKTGCHALRPKLSWVIAGGESGNGARPCRPEWIGSIVRQCRDASVPCFVKQMGGNVVTRNDMVEDAFNGVDGWPDPDVEHNINGFREDYQGADCRIRLRDKKGGTMDEWPESLRIRQFPRTEAHAP